VTGCHPSSDGGEESPPPATEVATAKFNPATGSLPYPIDLYFSPTPGVQSDGTINMPASLTWHANLAAVNALDGWSTTASLDTSFTLPLDATSIGASTVKIVKLWLNPATKAPVDPADPNQVAAYLPAGATSPVAGILTYGTDFTADISDDIDSEGKILRITPLKPLDYSKGPFLNSGANAGKVLNVGYLVILTNGLRASSGVAVTPDTLYDAIKAAPSDCSTFTDATQNAVCRLTKAHLGIAQATGTSPADIVLSWGFSTQSIDDTFAVLAATSAPTATVVVPSGFNTAQVSGGALAGKADVYVGSTKLPYYLTPAATPTDTSINTKFWVAAGPPNPAFGLNAESRNLTMFNPVPAKVADVTVPLLVTIPNATSGCTTGMPAGGWPVAIVQHGITRNRSDALAMADGFADQCFIVAAIDLPLHGVTDTTSPLYCDPTKPQCVGATERTFNVDLLNNTTGAAGTDGVIDSSGSHWINLTSPLTSRDNTRQASADLITFAKSVTGLTTPAGAIPVNAARISFVGESLGAIVGTASTHFSPQLASSSLVDNGGLLSKLVLESPAFRDRIRAGLSARLVLDSYIYNLFFRDFQAVVDSSDPINHIRNAQLANPVHMMNVEGDDVVPNVATERLYLAGGITKLTTIGPNPVSAGTGAYAWLTEGEHGSMFSPAVGGLAATTEMQTQAIGFAATSFGVAGGPFVFLTNAEILDLD
jgi:hypothetical protein